MAHKPTSQLNLRIDTALKRAAEKAAAEDQRSLSSLTKVLLARHCKEREGGTEAQQSSKRGQK
jgi:hypothetical protein